MKAILKAMLPFVVLCIATAPLVAAGTFKINSWTSLFIDRNEPRPVQKAAQVLASDLQKVFSSPIQIVHDPGQAHATTLWISDRSSLPKSVTRPSGWERLHIQAAEHPWPGSPSVHAVVLTGSDMRGTIYPICLATRSRS